MHDIICESRGGGLCGINTQKYALLPKYKEETALYFYMEL